MRVSKENADLFFKLMWPLLAFANNKLEILPEVSTEADFDDVDFKDIARVRNALYENIHLFDSFIDENPLDIPLKELAIVSNWKNFVRAEFMIERYLKNFAIFISDNNKVYAVLSLRDSFDDLIPKFALPQRVKTVLLPFQNQIVYDGFFSTYNIYFGGGIKSDLKNIYMKAKRRDEIIYSLDPENAQKPRQKKAKAAKNWKPLLTELKKKAAKLRGGSGQSELLSPAFSLVKASLELADQVTEKNIESEDILNLLDKLERHLVNVEKELYYQED